MTIVTKIPLANVLLAAVSYPLVREFNVQKLYFLVILHMLCNYCQEMATRVVAWMRLKIMSAMDRLEKLMAEEKNEETENNDLDDSDNDFVLFDECDLLES